MTSNRVDQRTIPDALRAHNDRLRALEAEPSNAGVTDITSSDASITVTNPTGPTTDLTVNFPTPPSLTVVTEIDTGSVVASASSQNDVTWSGGGGSLLDMTTPNNPVIINAGLYLFSILITAQIGGTATTQYARVLMVPGTIASSGSSIANTVIPLAANRPTSMNIGYANTFGASSPFFVQINNDDTLQSHTFSFVMTVVSLS